MRNQSIFKNRFLIFFFFILFSFNGFAHSSFSQDTITIQRMLFEGDSLSSKKEYVFANKIYTEISRTFEKNKNWKSYSNVSIKITENSWALGNKKEAFEYLKTIEEKIIQSFNNKNIPLAEIYHELAILCFRSLKDEDAIFYFKKALNIRLLLLPPTDSDIIKCYYNIGSCYNYLNNVDSAKFYLLQSIESNLERKIPSDYIVDSYRSLGGLYAQEGETYFARKYLLASIDYFAQYNKDKYWKIAKVYVELAGSFLDGKSKEDFKDALSYSKKAAYIFESRKSLSKNDWMNLSDAYHTVAFSFMNLKQLDSALIYNQKVIEINLKHLSDRKAKVALARSYNNTSLVYMFDEKYKKAENYILKSIKLKKNLGEREWLATSFDNYGDIYFRQQQYLDAIKKYNTGIEYLIPDFQVDNIWSIPNSSQISSLGEGLLMLTLLDAKAYALFKNFEKSKNPKDLKIAFQTYKLLEKLIDQTRSGFYSDASKGTLLHKSKTIFENAIEICLSLKEQSGDKIYLEKAFAFVEKSKAIILLEAMKDGHSKKNAGIPDSILQKEKDLKIEMANQERNHFNEQMQTERDLDKINELNKVLTSLRLQHQKLIDSFKSDYPKYYQEKYEEKPIAIKTLQEKLKALDATILNYFVGEKRLYIFRLSRNELSVHSIEIDGNFPLHDLVDGLRKGIYGRFSTSKDEITLSAKDADRLLSEKAFTLYQHLIQSVVQKNDHRLFIVLDDLLGYVPFEVLLTESVHTDQLGVENYSNWPFLLKQELELTYHYSASSMIEMLRDGEKTSKGLLAIAPDFDKQIPKDTVNQNPYFNLSNLGSMNYNEDEVDFIHSLLSGKTLKKAKANKVDFEKIASEYRFLHFATHGNMNDDYPNYSYVAFTPDTTTRSEMSLLLVSDLYNLKLNADMVVLSACETGTGRINRGEGIMSLARGFSYAGAKSIITSLWAVNQQSTNELMKSFYQKLVGGATKSKSIQNAKLDFIKKYEKERPQLTHPYYWAGFVNIGNMNPIEIPDSINYFAYGIGGGIFSLLLLLFLFFRRKNKKIDIG